MKTLHRITSVLLVLCLLLGAIPALTGLTARAATTITGVKLTDYIRSVRLDAAKVMLLASRKDIQQISEELQFGSRSYFDRVFRQEVGISPKQYRETMGQGRKETP